MNNQLLSMTKPIGPQEFEVVEPAKRDGHFEPIKEKPLRGPHVEDIVKPPKDEDDLGVWGHHVWTAGDDATTLYGKWSVIGDSHAMMRWF